MADDKKTVLQAMKKAGKPLKNGEIAELAALPKETVTKLITELKNSGDIISPKKCYYEVKK